MSGSGARTRQYFVSQTSAPMVATENDRRVTEVKLPSSSCIIRGLIAKETIMEAERLNSLQSLLDDLATRATELRRYL
jgi:hypothetical protein